MVLNNYQIFLIYIVILKAFIKSYIVIPLKSTDELYFSKLSKALISINDQEKITKILQKYINNVLYTDLLIGEPNQKAIGFISQNDYGFNFYEEFSTKELMELGSNNYNFYLKANSKTIIPTDEYNYEHSFWSYFSHGDFLYLYKFNDNITFNIQQFDDKKPTKTEKRINFVYSIRNSSKISNNSNFIDIQKKFEKEQNELRKFNFTNFSYFSIGLNFGSRNNYRVTKSFIEEFFAKKEISNREWNIYYSNNKKFNSKNSNGYNAFLIMGASPHIYFSNIFNEKDQFSTYADKSLFSNSLKLSFYDIYTKINNSSITLSKFDKTVDLNFNFGLIRATYQAKTVLEEKYFSNLIKLGKCFESRINKTEYTYYAYYYCNKNKITNEEIKSFPGIFLRHNEFSYIFELNSDDLFETFGDVIIFKIIFDTLNGWSLGKLFLTKYMLSFDDENKKIYFYNKQYDDKDDEYNGNESNKNKYFTAIIVLIIIGVIIFGILGFFIGKCIYNKKKIDSHELYDLELENFDKKENKDANGNEEKLIP